MRWKPHYRRNRFAWIFEPGPFPPASPPVVKCYHRRTVLGDRSMKAAAKPKQTPAEAYEAWYDEQIRLGLEDIEAGRVVTDEEAERHTDRLFKKLERKYGHKAA